jgi:hypothetical protein
MSVEIGRHSAFDHDEPWQHEGAAEAMAVYALGAAGVWDSAQVAAFAATAKERCAAALGGKTLADVGKQGGQEAVYGCGFGLWWGKGIRQSEALWRTFSN